MLLQVVQVILLRVVLLLICFGDAVMCDSALICFKWMNINAVDNPALQDQVSFGLTLVVLKN